MMVYSRTLSAKLGVLSRALEEISTTSFTMRCFKTGSCNKSLAAQPTTQNAETNLEVPLHQLVSPGF